jgi:hypothetical protein
LLYHLRQFVNPKMPIRDLGTWERRIIFSIEQGDYMEKDRHNDDDSAAVAQGEAGASPAVAQGEAGASPAVEIGEGDDG